jgi:glycosyltransferase involved in cell wall biosynthesis
MRILVINQFFWPDTAATGQLLSDLARVVDPESHTVTVFCGTTQYGSIDSGSPPPVEIVRFGGIGFSRARLRRLFSYASFFLGAAVRALRTPRPDIVLTMTTPPLISLLGTLVKQLRGARHIVWEMDLYPDIAVDLKVLKPGSITTRLVGWLADFSRKRADGIIALGEDMKARIAARGIPEEKIVVAENWADGDEITPHPFQRGPLVVHYSGTLGLAHEQHTVRESMRQLRGNSSFRFVFVGGGACHAGLEQFCRAHDVDTAEFRPYTKRCDLSANLAEGHVGLVTQIPETLGAIVPSKIYGIMAAGRPILFIGPSGSTPARIIEQHGCGWRIDPGDSDSLVRLLQQLEANRDLLREAGVRARDAFEKHYEKSIGVARLLSILGLSEPATAQMANAATAS